MKTARGFDDMATFIRDDWPDAVGALALLLQVRTDALVGPPVVEVIGETPSPTYFFPRVLEDRVAVLDRIGAVKWDESTIIDLLRRTHPEIAMSAGDFSNMGAAAERDLSVAAYSLAYLSRTPWVAGLLLRFYVRLVRGPLDTATRYHMGSALRGVTMHLLYEIEGLEGAGDHEPFDWHGALNDWAPDDRHALLSIAGVRALRHPSFPPQTAWLPHTNVQPEDERWYRNMLRRHYASLGYDVRRSRS